MVTAVKGIVEKSEIVLFSDFWEWASRCIADIRQNGLRGAIPPDCVGDDWDDDFANSYENIHPILKEFFNAKFYEVPPGIPNCSAPFVAETGHQALMFFLNPTNALYGAAPFFETKEFQNILDSAISELKKKQENWVHSGDVQTKPSVRNRRKNRNGQLSEDGLLLHAYLCAGHKCNSEEPDLQPLGNQTFMAEQLSHRGRAWDGTRVSRAMKELFEQVNAFHLLGNEYMERYKKLCDERQICTWLLQIHLRTMSRGIQREFGVENLDRFQKPDEDE
ncbi:MAG: hypothetical protein JSS49_21760 [Planctomycetes bacterium]|nr:hypothetical protein [Planctomycetota bacterium]